MTGSGDVTPSYRGVAELTRQLDQEKIEVLSRRVEDLRRQNEELKVSLFGWITVKSRSAREWVPRQRAHPTSTSPMNKIPFHI